MNENEEKIRKRLIQLQDVPGKSPEEIAQLRARLQDSYSDDIISDSSNKRKGKKIRFITRAMAEDFSREQLLFSTLIETIFYVIFTITCVIHVSNLKSSEMFYMNEAMKQGLLDKEFSRTSGASEPTSPIKFEGISTVNDLWSFIINSFIGIIYFDKTFENKEENAEGRKLSILYENMVLGVPRLRQVRVKQDSCNIHPYFQKLFKYCYAAYDEDTESRETFGEKTSPAWVYSNEEVTQNIDIMGRVGSYGGGGYYIDLDNNATSALSQVHDLIDKLWITRATRAVFLHFAVYNTNLNVFGVCKIIFELPPTGGVLPNYEFDIVKLISRTDDWNFFVYVCELIYYIFILFYLLQSIREFLYFKWKYFKRFWSYIDCTISALGICTFVISNFKRGHVESFITRIKENPHKFGNIEYLADLEISHDDISSIILFFVFIRFFKYLNLNRTMGQLNNTLKKCSRDVLGFSVMFFIIFFAYAQLGFLLFGTDVKEFRTFGHSMFTLLRTILGDFDYNAIEASHRNLAPVYFLSYIFLVFFVLLNMFLAIINDTYTDVKTELAVSPKELQMTEYVKMHLMRFLRKFKCFRFKVAPKQGEQNVTGNEIKITLEKCGFNYLEIEMFFARYNINPLALVTEYDVNRLVRELETMTQAKIDEGESEDRKDDTEELMQLKQQLKTMEDSMFGLGSKIDELIYLLEKIAVKKERKDKRLMSSSSQDNE